MRTALLAPLVVVLVGGLNFPLLASMRLSELNEHNPVHERTQEISAANRCDAHRHVRLDQRRPSFASAPASKTGHARIFVLTPPTGHRLPNGLLAPLTC